MNLICLFHILKLLNLNLKWLKQKLLYALLGSPSLGTKRIKVKINGHWLIDLINTGSTHNFLDAATISILRLSIDPTVTFEVKVANGATIKTKDVCLDVRVVMQGHIF